MKSRIVSSTPQVLKSKPHYKDVRYTEGDLRENNTKHLTCPAGLSLAGQQVRWTTGSAAQPTLGGESWSSPVVFSQAQPHT